ncbi:MAG: TIGR00341 family protein [Cyanobacteria bacterium P01_D01_bin.1]
MSKPGEHSQLEQSNPYIEQPAITSSTEPEAEQPENKQPKDQPSKSKQPKSKDDRPDPWRPRFVVWVRYYFPPSVYRPAMRVARWLGQKFAINSGDWHWMANNPMPLKSLNRSLWRNADPSFNYYMMLFLSAVISTLGLLAGSAAAIIGAMIVAPLMGPIIGMAFAITMGNRRLLKRSGLSVVTGALLTVGSAYLICSIVGLNTLNPEIVARTRPTLIDLVIGLAAGAAGAFAKTRRGVADALPGVAIAVALVPPLSVIGIGLAYGNQTVFTGSILLFATNLAGIILSGGLVFIWQDYGSLKRARRGLATSIVVLSVLGVPLGLSMRRLIVEERTRTLVGSLIRSEIETFRETDIRRLRVVSRDEIMQIELEVAAPVDSISQDQIATVHQFLESRLERPIELRVSIFPVSEFEVEPSEVLEGG